MSAPDVTKPAELPPLTEAEIAEIEGHANAATPAWTLALHIDEPRAIVSADDMSVSLLALDRDGMAIFDRVEDARFAVEAREIVPRLLADLRRAHARIAELEAQIAATAEAHREDQRRADELAGVPG